MPAKSTKKIVQKIKPVVRVKRASGLAIAMYDINGKQTSTLDLPKELFSSKFNPKLLAHYVRTYLTNQRQGTASTKTRGEVTGSTRKIYRQKGTGRARHGSIKAPIFVGGGVVGGPKPKTYDIHLNKKQKKLALLAALSQSYRDGKLVGYDESILSMKPKTKVFASFLRKIGMGEKNILLIVPESYPDGIKLATRNIASVTTMPAKTINSYAIMLSTKMLIGEKAVTDIKNHFLKQNDKR